MAKLSRLPSIELMLPEMSPMGWCGKRKAYFCSARRQAVIFCSPGAARANVLFFYKHSVMCFVTKCPVHTQRSWLRNQYSYCVERMRARIALVPAFTCWLRRTLSLRKRHALSMCSVPDLTFKIFPLATLWVVTRTYWGAAQVTLPRTIHFFLQWTTASCSTPLTLVRVSVQNDFCDRQDASGPMGSVPLVDCTTTRCSFDGQSRGRACQN